MSYDRFIPDIDEATQAKINAPAEEIPPLRTPTPPVDARVVPDEDYNPNKAERPAFPPPF